MYKIDTIILGNNEIYELMLK